jgi:hypothetical protein
VASESKPLSFSESRDRVDSAPLSQALSELQKVTRLLRRDALALAFLTLVVLFGSVSFGFGGLLKASFTFFLTSISSFLITAFIALVLAVHFETIRKRGDILFKEISDEIQWNLRFSDSESTDTAPHKRPQFNARLTLRSFAQASDLPLIPGRYGPLMYVLIDLVSVLLAVFLALKW